jgi:hypothetical protein
VPLIDDPSARIEALLDREEARIANIFRVAIRELRDEIDLDELADLIEQGRHGEAIERLRVAAERLGSASNVTFVTAGQSAADFLREAGLGRIVFDQVNLNAVAAMQRTRLDLIREFTDEQRRAASFAMVSGVEAGINPRAQARNFRDSVGLTESQWRHVANYRAALERVGTTGPGQLAALDRELRDRRGDRSVRAAVKRGQPLPPEKVDWLVNRYSLRYIKFRAEVIGRTEALRAVHQGNEELYRQAIAAGHIDPRAIKRTWRTRLDNRERRTHRFLNGEERNWGEVWATENGVLRYPGDREAPALETIQCFPGNASIFAGGLKGVIVRHYCGELVQLRIGGGVDQAVTPNHPVLTQWGWIAARQVVKGDYLIHAEFADLAAAPHPDIQHGYASAEDLARLAKLSGDIQRAGREIVDLHGEMPDHEVEIVAPPRELRDALKALGEKAFGNLGLECSDVAAGHLLFAGMSGQGLGPRDTVDGSRVRGGSERLAFFGSKPSKSYPVRLAAAADREAHFAQAVCNDVSAESGLAGYGENRLLLAVEALDRWVKGSALFSPVAVTGTGSSWHDGPVYNFETDTGLVSNGGIIYHNCRCALQTRIRAL